MGDTSSALLIIRNKISANVARGRVAIGRYDPDLAKRKGIKRIILPTMAI